MFARILTFLLISAWSLPLLAFGEDDFLMPDEAFKPSVSTQQGVVNFRWEIADDYYLYRNKFKFQSQTSGIELGEPEYPPAKTKSDPNFGDTEVYYKDVAVSVPVTRGEGPAEIKVTYQGCAEAGLCYPPQKKVLQVAAVAASQAVPVQEAVRPLNDLANDIGLGGFDDDIMPVEEAFRFDASVMDAHTLRLSWQVADTIYMYADKLKIAVEGGAELGEFALPEPTLKYGLKPDGEEGEIEVYLGLLEFDLPLKRTVAEETTINLKVVDQGCAEAGICYPPQRRSVNLALPAVEAADTMAITKAPPVSDTPAAVETSAAPVTVRQAAETCAEQLDATEGFINRSFWAIVGAFFLIGVALSLTPCVFPMIPILSGIITGHGEKITPRKGFALSLVYVLAMAVTYTLAGILAALSGANLQVMLQHPVALTAFAALFVALAFSMFGFYELQLPTSLQARLAAISNRQKGGSMHGVAVMGFLSALIVGPCVAPPLAASLAYISQTGDVALGGISLFAMSIGMGIPLLFIGASAGKFLPKAGGWMDIVKAVFGVVMLGIAITMLERLAPTYLPAYVPMIMWGLLLIGTAIYMGALELVPEGSSGWKKLWKGVGAAFLVWGGVVLIGAAMGHDDPLQPLASHERVEFKRITTVVELEAELSNARAAGKPVVLDFYADWCVYCKVMERKVFPHPLVQEALDGKLLLQADVTASSELLNHFGLTAPPTILLFGADGEEKCDNRLIGNVTVEQLLSEISKAKL